MDPLDEEPKDGQAGRDGKPKPDRDSGDASEPSQKNKDSLTNKRREGNDQDKQTEFPEHW
jgi:hypothetical protein